MEIRTSALIGRSRGAMFDLIEAAEHYPAFLPWCARATVLERNESVVAATIAIEWHGVGFEITTRNRKRRPEWLEFALERGPFRKFRGEWQLKPLGASGSRIDFVLHYELASDVLGRAASPAFERIANTMFDAFVRRAAELGDRVPALAWVIAPDAPSQPDP